MSLETNIKSRAAELGFDLCGITTGATPEHDGAFRRWLAEGCHGEMRYLTRRLDPKQILPGCRSIIVVGMNYHHSGAPHLAQYVGERDYHDVMGEKLRDLAKWVDGLWYVDTGPLLERDLAQRAGLGWIGKHTNLIHRQLGNWFFLGEVLTKLDLLPDMPERGYCGSCTRCLKACPTGALVAPYRLDARRCISYLTIELKGSIPVELRSSIGTRLFGCDECLQACPWNRFAKTVVPARKWPVLTEMSFEDCRGTPLERLGRARFLRNQCVALGNSGDPSALPALERACQDDDPLVREHATWAMQRFTGPGSKSEDL